MITVRPLLHPKEFRLLCRTDPPSIQNGSQWAFERRRGCPTGVGPSGKLVPEGKVGQVYTRSASEGVGSGGCNGPGHAKPPGSPSARRGDPSPRTHLGRQRPGWGTEGKGPPAMVFLARRARGATLPASPAPIEAAAKQAVAIYSGHRFFGALLRTRCFCGGRSGPMGGKGE